MTADMSQKQLKDLKDFRKGLVDTGWKMYWERECTETLIASAKRDEFISNIFAQIIYEVNKLPREAKPTLTMTRPLFELVFKDVFALFKEKPPTPLFMDNEVNVVEDDKMWWTLGNKYDVVIQEENDDC